MLEQLTQLRRRKTGRVSSYDTTGRNADAWTIPAGQSRVLADLRGPGQITHIWMTQAGHYREVLLRITWDDAAQPSVLCPLGDFFCLGHGMVNSFQSRLFSASTGNNNASSYGPGAEAGVALNCYALMPFRQRALIELVNQSAEAHGQYFYIDYETLEKAPAADTGYFHAEFRRTNPFGGWGHHLAVNTPEVEVANKERLAWDNNYVILETRGRGHYIGCNLSVTNFQGTWWGEGDDMIWVDGYKWPPDLHGTGSEDYLNQAWGMQPNAFLHNGSSLHESQTGGYQTSYVFHVENPVRFEKEIKVTIEHGHGNHLANEMSSVAYWYAAQPAAAVAVPPVRQRLPVGKDAKGHWDHDPQRQCPGKPVRKSPEMIEMLKPRAPWGPWRVRRRPALRSPGAVAKALAATRAQVFDADHPLGELRIALAGDKLAVHARVFDVCPVRVESRLWEGSALELFGCGPAGTQAGQVILAPAVGADPAVGCAYRQGRPYPASGVRVQSKPLQGGYEISALIPLELLAIPRRGRAFLFDASLSVAADRTGQSWRHGLVSSRGNWAAPQRFGRVVVA